MAVIYATSIKTARMQAVADGIDAGASSGTLEIGTSGMASTLAIFTLVEPVGSVAGDVLTLDFDPDISTTAIADGTAAAAQIKDGSGTVVVSGLTVGTSAADIILDSVAISNGQTITIATGTITHAT